MTAAQYEPGRKTRSFPDVYLEPGTSHYLMWRGLLLRFKARFLLIKDSNDSRSVGGAGMYVVLM